MMGKDKFTKRKEWRRLIRGEMVKRGIYAKDIAKQLKITAGAVSKGYGVPRIQEALIEAGVPARLFNGRRAG
jgi:thiamine biosynthesis lipoprotein ApbE